MIQVLFALTLFASGVVGSSDCVQTGGSRILASDLATKIPPFDEVEPGKSFGYSPSPGTRRSLGSKEIARWLQSAGISTTIQESSTICVERKTMPLSREEVESAIRAAALAAVDGDESAVRWTVIDFSKLQVPAGRLEFPASGLSPVRPNEKASTPRSWRGRLIYDGQRTLTVWARVQVEVKREALVATAAFERGTVLSSTSYRHVERWTGELSEPLQKKSSVEIAGLQVRRSILPGQEIQLRDLITPRQVQAGDAVEVLSAAGLAEVRFTAIAASSGSTGAMVLIKNPESGRPFRARVTGRGLVEIGTEPSGHPPSRPDEGANVDLQN